LQHLHLPDFFHPRDRQWRNIAYPLFCSRATLVPVEDSWTRQDVIDHFDLSPDKVIVVPIPAPTAVYDEPTPRQRDEMGSRLRFPKFVFYPAQTWPHKNHIGLLEAL